ncbi:MAG: AAA family ATPase [Prevotellaceae bacterium]|jgi:exodeoxyribonuclease-5|nr:AAA family ATPase [Prevotellaceae bacterium]
MLSDFLEKKIVEQLPYTPTEEQAELIVQLSKFLLSQQNDELFLLTGYAGTGKTSLVSALIRVMAELKQKTLLLAPTGRAAKVFSAYSGQSAFTIHKKIFRQKSAVDFRFELAENLYKHTLFIVDEASMIANSGDSAFGTGRLLDDLISFVYSGEGCRLLLMGDSAQLPPVGQAYSPALEKDNLEGYSLSVSEFCLTQVLRQSRESGILHNATLIRRLIQNGQIAAKPKFELQDFADIQKISGAELIDTLNQSYNRVGEENCIVITRSNKRAALYNKGIRAQVMQKEDEITNGDLLMITKNNYFWAKDYENLDFIANGDIVEITRIRRYHSMYNMRFVDVSLRFLDYEYELDARLLLDALHAETPAELEAINKKLFEQVSEDYADIGNRRERMKQIRQNEYYNALQVKFAYAVTCHKAQGGQWNTVFIDQGYLPNNPLDEDFFHWLYTALTRASRQLYLVNFDNDFFR